MVKSIIITVFCLVLLLVSGGKKISLTEPAVPTERPVQTPYPTIEPDDDGLTDRQKEILESVGLQADSMGELTIMQKGAICAIEDMLCYLEEKYPGEKFEYKGYWSGIDGQKEHLEAECRGKTVTVYSYYTDSTFYYTDDYVEVFGEAAG